LTVVTRQEIELIEYGPTPFPAYDTADIVGVRSSVLSDVDAMLLRLILENLADGDAALDPIVAALCKTDQALDQAQAVLAQILDTANPDDAGDSLAMGMDEGDLDRSAYLTRLRSLAVQLDERLRDRSAGAPDEGLASADSSDEGENAKPKLTRVQVRARAYRMGVLS
jgi:hypothetical protein